MKSSKILILLIILVLAAIFLLKHHSITLMSNQVILTGGNHTKEITIEGYEWESKSTELSSQFIWKFKIEYQEGQKVRSRIAVDDCAEALWINGIELNLKGIPKDKLCDHVQGFLFDFTPHLQVGINDIVFQIRDYGGGYKVSYSPRVWGNIGLENLAMSFFIIPLLLLWQYFYIHPSLRSIETSIPLVYTVIFIGFALYIMRFLVVGDSENSHDYDGHIFYIKAIFDNWSLPNPYACRECYQAPIYHTLAALIYGFGERIGLPNPMYAVKAIG